MRRSPRPSPSPTRESLRRALIRDAFYRQGPFLGSGGHYSPGPTTDSPLLAMRRPLNGTLAPPWVLVRTSPHSGKQAEPRRTFHSLHPTMVSPTAVRFELDPRSLDPAALFGARMPSLFEARRRLTTSATCFYDVRATKPAGSRFLARTMASTTFLFFCTTTLIAEQ